MKLSGLRRFVPSLWIAFAWWSAWFSGRGYVESHPTLWYALLAFLDRFTFRVLGGFPAAQAYVADLVRAFGATFPLAVSLLAVWSTFVVPLGFLVRLAARARLRVGEPDPLAQWRARLRAHPRWTRALSVGAAPAIGTALIGLFLRMGGVEDSLAILAPLALGYALLHYGAARSATRALLAPTLDPTDDARVVIDVDEIAFNAVAVTAETRGAVAAVAFLSLGMATWIAALPLHTLFTDRRLFAAVAAYIAFATAIATVFRLASRVAVGTDGVLVKGTSPTRFFAYRDLDAVRVGEGDIELLRRARSEGTERVVLRLQLHGADAVRRDAIVQRIAENIARVQRGEQATAAQLVSSSSREQLARVASGGADYRAASLSRDALWALVEGPVVDASARRAAAEALAEAWSVEERGRLRVAAARCADPEVRVALAELAEAPDDEDRAETAARTAAART